MVNFGSLSDDGQFWFIKWVMMVNFVGSLIKWVVMVNFVGSLSG